MIEKQMIIEQIAMTHGNAIEKTYNNIQSLDRNT